LIMKVAKFYFELRCVSVTMKEIANKKKKVRLIWHGFDTQYIFNIESVTHLHVHISTSNLQWKMRDHIVDILCIWCGGAPTS
jgi:hypothetical protein